MSWLTGSHGSNTSAALSRLSCHPWVIYLIPSSQSQSFPIIKCSISDIYRVTRCSSVLIHGDSLISLLSYDLVETCEDQASVYGSVQWSLVKSSILIISSYTYYALMSTIVAPTLSLNSHARTYSRHTHTVVTLTPGDNLESSISPNMHVFGPTQDWNLGRSFCKASLLTAKPLCGLIQFNTI